MEADDRKRLEGFISFAKGVLGARDKVQMSMGTGLGVFHESQFEGLPGIRFDLEDGAWLRVARQRETVPPAPEDYVAAFLDYKGSDPAKPPKLVPAIGKEVENETASDLIEMGLVRPDVVHEIVEKGVAAENRVRVILHAEDLPEMRRAHDQWLRGAWSDWAEAEKPVRKAIQLYNGLFAIHTAMHSAESTPPEMVWGIGIGRWRSGGAVVDMPLIEQAVDIEVEDSGPIAIRPRAVRPSLSLKPYLELEVDGSDRLQTSLQQSFDAMIAGDAAITPFSTDWEGLLETAASQLASDGEHVSRIMLDEGRTLAAPGDTLRFTSTWALFGRARSGEARMQDLAALARSVENETAEIPESIRGFTRTPPSAPSEAEEDEFGITPSVLTGSGGSGKAGWTMPERSGGTSGRSPNPAERREAEEKVRRQRNVHFFPLPFNEDQGRIVSMLEQDDTHLVSVTGPPGTGKTHSIANIVSHMMANGKRVLVTARTPEAIAAVREKLPESLQSLVIASVGTDRESARQLEGAVSELSDEVVGMDRARAREEVARLEDRIIECDRIAEEADAALARIAQANFAPLIWRGEERPPMELVAALAELECDYGWFTDRPDSEPPAQLEETLAALRALMPELAAEIIYAGSTLPSAEDIPTTADIITAHQAHLAHRSRPQVDYGAAPRMARDTAGVDQVARGLLASLEGLAEEITALSEDAQDLTRHLGESPVDGFTADHLRQVGAFIARQEGLAELARVRVSLGICPFEELLAAATRGAAGGKPVGIALFNRALKEAVASAKVDGRSPVSREDWALVVSLLKFSRQEEAINSTLSPLVDRGLVGELPGPLWEMGDALRETRSDLDAALALHARIEEACGQLAPLFPYGLDLAALRSSLDLEPALFALRGNLPDTYRAPEAIGRLREIAAMGDLPIHRRIGEMAAAMGNAETDPGDLLAARAALTDEIGRLAAVAPKLEALGRHLDHLREAGAPDWAARLEDRPLDAADLIPEGWRDAWDWARMRGRIDLIVAAGNGDEHRERKAEALARRRRHFEALIRTRTLLGLHRRMTPGIRSQMSAFTQAVSKIGRGTGKNAARYRRAAQEAARGASRAAPVWIMPEYKIPEQLPPELGEFDLVILDEASQSDITAIGALARGKKILIVGDEEQVSPAAVAIPTHKINALRAQFLQDLPNPDLIDEKMSIFEMAMRMHPDTHLVLREHFRCVAPIIQFSTQFYQNRLVPLRMPRASERFDPPLVDVHIKGAVRQGKTNKSEARYIVDEIARIMADPVHAKRDIGVISLLGGEQADLIGRLLMEDERIGSEGIQARSIIVGDARTMQGQERSIVFLSMVSTPRDVRSASTRDVQQRYNVAMSRAADRLYLVRSVTLDDLKPGDIKAKVLEHFDDPMPKGRSEAGLDLMERCDSGFEREVLGILLDANYRVRPQVSAGAYKIDLVVEGSEDRRLAIELDGDAFHGPDEWERDMMRQAALERAGWTFWRVFGSQWQAQKNHWWKHLTDTLTRMGIEPIGAEALDERFTELRIVGAQGTPLEDEGDLSTLEPEVEPEPEVETESETGPSMDNARGADRIIDQVSDTSPDSDNPPIDALEVLDAPRHVRGQMLTPTTTAAPADVAAFAGEDEGLDAWIGANRGSREVKLLEDAEIRVRDRFAFLYFVGVIRPDIATARTATKRFREARDRGAIPSDRSVSQLKATPSRCQTIAHGSPLDDASRQKELPLSEEQAIFDKLERAFSETYKVEGDDERAGGSQDADRYIRIGSTVKLEKLGAEGGRMRITIVEDQHDPDLGLIGAHTPLAGALLDAALGDRIEYQAGAYLREVRVVGIE